MSSVIESNPLVSYRAPSKMPRGVPRAPVHGRHFIPNQEDVVNDVGMLNVYRGDFTYTKDKTLEIEIGFWEDSGSERSVAMLFSMQKRGWQFALAKEWELADRIKLAWRKDVGGRITFGGRSGGTKEPTMVVMWRTGEQYDKYQKQREKQSDNINRSVEEQMAENVDNMAHKFEGVGLSSDLKFGGFQIQDDDEEERIDTGNE